MLIQTYQKKGRNKNEKIFEKLITELSIGQNITFSEEDIKAIRKIMNVELDDSFVKDLNEEEYEHMVNPGRQFHK